jgi:hypothetical protein
LSILLIPKSDREGLAIVREMPDATFESFVVETARSPNSISLPGLAPDDANRALDALNTMFTVKAFSDVDAEEFLDDVCETLISTKDLGAGEQPRFRERLKKLLEIESLSTAAKAAALQMEHAHLYCSARVLTDARPVYGNDVTTAPVAMTITHELKISYHEGPGGNLREIYVGLGSEDLRSLMHHLKRAQEKATSLRAALDLSKVKFIDPQEQRS